MHTQIKTPVAAAPVHGLTTKRGIIPSHFSGTSLFFILIRFQKFPSAAFASLDLPVLTPVRTLRTRSALKFAFKSHRLDHRPYTQDVARGWESKSVEAQQSEAVEEPTSPRTRLSREQAAQFREREDLRLARQKILQELGASNHPRHRELLQKALAELDERLRQLD